MPMRMSFSIRSGLVLFTLILLPTVLVGQDGAAPSATAAANDAGDSGDSDGGQGTGSAASGQASGSTSTTTAGFVDPPVSTADRDPGEVFYFDFEDTNAGRLEEVLPFDVQFYLRIPVDESVVSLDGRYVGDTRPLICTKAFPRVRSYVDYGSGLRELAPIEPRRVLPIGMTRIFIDRSEEGGNKRHAELNVAHGLLPKRHYCFELTRLRKLEIEPEAFLQSLVDSVDLALRKRNEQLSMSKLRVEGYENLRHAISGAIEGKLASNERIVRRPKFLDSGKEILELSAKAVRELADIRETHRKREQKIASLQRNAKRALPLLERLVMSPALKKLRAAGISPADPLARHFSGKLDTMAWILLAAESENEREKRLQAIAEGETSLLASTAVVTGAKPPKGAREAKPFEETWLTRDLDVREANLQETSELLDQLKTLILILIDEELAEEAGVTAEKLSELKEQVKDAAEEISALLRFSLTSIEEILDLRLQRIRQLVQKIDIERVRKQLVDTLLIEGTTLANFTVRANWYLGMDLGGAWSPDIEDFFAYVGMNIYFRPVNKKAPLKWSDFREGFRTELMKRLSVTIGVPVREKLEMDGQFQGVSLEDDTGLIADKPLIFALGFRLSDFFRISAGTLVFKDQNPNPLIDDSELAWSPLVSLSIDWDVRTAFRDRFSRKSSN